ncbi:hypothetical protein VOLCADRAFT_107890 [Volvox carteri f. nagariensis]|uniref:Uncharacterized protein n=1 Tax=Volvox carteri f. nagariensis TaxID=3068 RepID=D8UH20_VOLCA|nr:uncharacterized protein VOLCADRAFT_107890 [Volvox carteri f. nagariensis]EFJ40967.1 hypothetical protein VOLCADRAFT_107890 [Volvox carteri f. nagariensis]|eukprot:XP_002957941.1 hypothetical protein VOLCADRAFT_107890 [Volvox carteri f. nagariensis]
MNHGACMEVFGAEKSQASAMEVLEKPPCTVLYPQFCVQALCGFDGSSCGVKYASFAAVAPAVLDTDAGMPCFQTCCRSAGFEARRRCPAGVLGPRDIEAAIMDTGGDAGRALAWYPGLLMAWRFDKADTFFRENQLPAYYGEIDSIRCTAVCRVSGPQQKSPIEAFSRRCFTASRCDTASRDRPKCHVPSFPCFTNGVDAEIFFELTTHSIHPFIVPV